MAPDDRHANSTLPLPPSDAGGRLEDELLSRRSFLAGIGIGGVVGASAAVGLTGRDAGFLSLTTLAGGASLPTVTRYVLPAVDPAGGGLVVAVAIELANGDGGLFVDVGDVEVRHDPQLALREAAGTASRYTGEPLDGTTIHVTFSTASDGPVALRGKSWEAGLTVALVAALGGAALSRERLITGVVARDGSLLPVGGIEAKAEAARAAGASELLVPTGQATDVAVDGLRLVEVRSIPAAIDRILG